MNHLYITLYAVRVGQVIFGDIAISTGYAPFGNIKVKYDILRKYDNTARKIVENWNIKYDTKVEKVNKLLEKFLEEVKKEV